MGAFKNVNDFLVLFWHYVLLNELYFCIITVFCGVMYV